MQINLVLENCESISFFDYERDVMFFETSAIHEHYLSVGRNLQKQSVIAGFTIAFHRNAAMYHSFSEPMTAIQRLNQKDVTQIVITHDDGTVETLHVSWDSVDDMLYSHDRQGMHISQDGNVIYYCEGADYISQLRMCPDMVDAYA